MIVRYSSTLLLPLITFVAPEGTTFTQNGIYSLDKVPTLEVITIQREECNV